MNESKVRLDLTASVEGDECSLEPECAFLEVDTRGLPHCSLFGPLLEREHKAPARNVCKIRPLRNKHCIEMGG